MFFITRFRILIVSTTIVLSHTADIPNCKFDDTVDLTNAKKFANGSYLYASIIIPAQQVGIYDYEEIYNGKRLPLPPHPRGCVCHERNCIKFCCHPTKELIANSTRHCTNQELNAELKYDPYIDVLLNNGNIQKRHVTEDFVVVQGVPCEGAYHLLPQLDEDDRWEIFENGTLLRHYDKALLSRRDHCFMPIEVDENVWALNPMNCPIINQASLSNQINNIAMAISVPFIILTILVYALVPELQNLHGKCLISYLTPLAIGYTILCSITLSDVVFPHLICSCMGYFGYYCFMSAFFWLNVISFDLWQNFRLTGSVRFGQRKRFLLYSAYAWGIPACLTIIVIAIQNSNIDELYKPGIGDDYCWLKTDDWSAMIYFFGVNLIIVLIDMTFFSMTYYKITVMQKDIDKIIRNDANEGRHKLRNHKNNFGLFLRLFLIMGISWLLDIASYIELLAHPGVINPLYYISDFMNAILGLLIFVSFVLKRKVLSLIKRRIFSKKDETDHSTRTTECSEEEISLNGMEQWPDPMQINDNGTANSDERRITQKQSSSRLKLQQSREHANLRPMVKRTTTATSQLSLTKIRLSPLAPH